MVGRAGNRVAVFHGMVGPHGQVLARGQQEGGVKKPGGSGTCGFGGLVLDELQQHRSARAEVAFGGGCGDGLKADNALIEGRNGGEITHREAHRADVDGGLVGQDGHGMLLFFRGAFYRAQFSVTIFLARAMRAGDMESSLTP